MKKKVLHIVNDLRIGGVSSVVLNLVRDPANSRYRYEIVNLSGAAYPDVLDLFRNSGITIHNFKYVFEDGYGLKDQFRKAFGEKKYLGKNAELIRSIQNLEADILHFHTLPRELMLGRAAAKGNESLLVYTDHLTRIRKKEIKNISKLLVPFPFKQFYKKYHVIAVSKTVANYLHEFGITTVLESLTVLPNKIPHYLPEVNYAAKGQLKVVYVSRISAVKGHKDLLNAWALLPALNISLYIVGPDELNGEIQKLAAASSFANEIVFTGSRKDVQAVVSAADIGVFPSHQEGLPVALLEMMQAGLPCVVSDIDEIKDIVFDGIDALSFKCGDSKDLAAKLQLLAADRELREKIGRSAAALVAADYSEKDRSLSAEYEAFYDKIIQA
ncbi:MAG: glycosyltransferase family 4 [Bacteroidetes bacterium]|jgi:glycosyltransferase involved in cell wall biosynthesis|nr:glycosyltransferase family 4 [Bacteroidota bacterium]